MRTKMLQKLMLSFGVLGVVLSTTWAIKVDAEDRTRNVVRERDYDRLVDRGAKNKVPDPADRGGPLDRCPDSPTGDCDDDRDIAVLIEIVRDKPMTELPPIVPLACQGSLEECQRKATDDCDSRGAPYRNDGLRFQKTQITHFQLDKACAWECAGEVMPRECVYEPGPSPQPKPPVTLPPGETSRFRVPCWLFPWTGYRCTDDDYPSTA